MNTVCDVMSMNTLPCFKKRQDVSNCLARLQLQAISVTVPRLHKRKQTACTLMLTVYILEKNCN